MTPPDHKEFARVLGRFEGQLPGATLIVVGGVHGNEPAGVLGIGRVVERLGPSAASLRGRFLALAGNRRALHAKKRYLERDLNRLWTSEAVGAVRALGPDAAASTPDAEELRELDAAIRTEVERVAALGGGPVFLLDLHTTSGPGSAFSVLDDTLRNRAFALEFPAPIVLGLEEELPGTLLYFEAGEGLVTLGFEAGQNDDPGSVDRAEAAIWIALEASGLLPRGARAEPGAARALLEAARGDLPPVVEVRYRHGISPADRFVMLPGFSSFARVKARQRLATDARGDVLAREDALLLMPLYQPQGSDGFFLARPVAPFWLRLSARLRRLRLAHHLDRLPGVRKHPDVPDAFLVDRRIARYLVRELFHLLGYRREADEGRLAVFRRRSHQD